MAVAMPQGPQPAIESCFSSITFCVNLTRNQGPRMAMAMDGRGWPRLNTGTAHVPVLSEKT